MPCRLFLAIGRFCHWRILPLANFATGEFDTAGFDTASFDAAGFTRLRFFAISTCKYILEIWDYAYINKEHIRCKEDFVELCPIGCKQTADAKGTFVYIKKEFPLVNITMLPKITQLLCWVQQIPVLRQLALIVQFAKKRPTRRNSVILEISLFDFLE